MNEYSKKSGMVSIVGRPNVGKSTLLNEIIKEKVSIVSKVPQTTRNQVRGIYNDERGQIVFIDTPGLHLGHDQLDDYMNQSSAKTFQDTDCIVYLVDVSRKVGQEEEIIADRLKDVKTPIIMGLNKVDVRQDNIPDYIDLWERIKGKKLPEMENFTLLPLSCKDGLNIDKLIEIIMDYLLKGPLLYPEDTIYDVPQKMAIADIIREKLFNLMEHEIPHSIGVVIEHMQPKKKKTIHIKALVMVDKESQKQIVIGKNGNVLKKVGTQARKDLEDILESKVFLELFVKVQKNWRDDINILRDFGYY